mmetsp:Transcript_3173/g.7345  ORF Transcript_3173/g.7345 Transcript_3173/m.7345 type:complete len:213 (-) Transcript_3173:109-747(-)
MLTASSHTGMLNCELQTPSSRRSFVAGGPMAAARPVHRADTLTVSRNSEAIRLREVCSRLPRSSPRPRNSASSSTDLGTRWVWTPVLTERMQQPLCEWEVKKRLRPCCRTDLPVKAAQSSRHPTSSARVAAVFNVSRQLHPQRPSARTTTTSCCASKAPSWRPSESTKIFLKCLCTARGVMAILLSFARQLRASRRPSLNRDQTLVPARAGR